MDGLLARNSRSFPRRLAEVADAPSRLFWRGSRCEKAGAWVGVVGSRAASGAELETARAIGRLVAEAGGVVVSGGALGVDAAAHRGALSATGKTIAVLGSGFNHLYPQGHRALFDDISRFGGALVTPYEPDVPPRRYHFVRRNRIIAGLCDLVVVVSASRSSGSLYTARAARDYRRRLAAVPGSPGCEALIAEQAFVVREPADVLALASAEVSAPVSPPPASELERAVLTALCNEPTDAEELARQLGTKPRDVDRALCGLELAHLALALPGRQYVRSALGETVRN